MRQRTVAIFLPASGLLVLGFLLACGGKLGPGHLSQGGTITLAVSDPATCGGTSGPYSHIFVTINNVQLSTNPNAAPGDSSFVDLTPGLRVTPTQVDLLGPANQCFLATLGSNLALAPGSYQQIRVFLAADGTSIPGNQCGVAANCVTLSSDPSNTPHPIQLSQETTQGIEIPASQIAGGQFTAVADQPQTLNLNFDACSSVVALVNNGFRFLPALLAGDTASLPAATPNSITGQVVGSTTQLPIPNAKVIVALERPDSRGVDRVVTQTLADAQGNFTFCPVLPGTYDVVVSAVDGSGGAFAATITLAVQPGNNLGKVPMVAVPGAVNTPGSITGLVTTSNSFSQPTSADILVAALQTTPQSPLTGITIPLLNSASSTLTVATEDAVSCPIGTECAGFTLSVPPANPNVGIFSAAGTTYQQGGGSLTYTVDAQAFVSLSGGTRDCNPDFQSFGPVTISPGGSAGVPTLVFGGCQ